MEMWKGEVFSSKGTILTLFLKYNTTLANKGKNHILLNGFTSTVQLIVKDPFWKSVSVLKYIVLTQMTAIITRELQARINVIWNYINNKV